MKSLKIKVLALGLILMGTTGCGNKFAEKGTDSDLEIELENHIENQQTETDAGDNIISGSFTYDYTRNLVDDAEDTATKNIYAVTRFYMKAVNECSEEVDFSELGLSDAVIDLGVEFAANVDPLCAFAGCKKKEGMVYQIEYEGGVSGQQERIENLKKEIDNILDLCVVHGNQEETVCNIYDYLVLRMHYKYDTVDTAKGQINTAQHSALTTYDALVNHIGVCKHFAEVFTILLNQVGIDNYLAFDSGESKPFESNDPVYDGQIYNIGHEWNVVNIDGECYHFDITYEVTNGVEEWEDEYGTVHHDETTNLRKFCGLSDKTRAISSHSENWFYLKMNDMRTKCDFPVCQKDLFEGQEKAREDVTDGKEEHSGYYDDILKAASLETKVEVKSKETENLDDTLY